VNDLVQADTNVITKREGGGRKTGSSGIPVGIAAGSNSPSQRFRGERASKIELPKQYTERLGRKIKRV
jgi:hypothetical protein